MADVPIAAARDDAIALDGRLAAAAARAEELVEVQVAIEAHPLVAVVGFRHAVLFLDRHALGAGLDARHAFGALVLRLRPEADAFQGLAAVVAHEAFGVEPLAGCADDAPGYGEGALGALRGGTAAAEWRPLGPGRLRGHGSSVFSCRAAFGRIFLGYRERSGGRGIIWGVDCRHMLDRY